MSSHSLLSDRFIKNPAYWAGVVAFFATLITSSYLWNAEKIDQHALQMGVLRARLVFNMIQTTRSWIAGHGGVFAPDSPELNNLLVREGNLRIHLTSLEPLNPANQADAWEASVLKRFESGLNEQVETVQGPEGAEFRYMAPLVVTQTCLQCHAAQGYKLGDIRGGIRVTQPAGFVFGVVNPQRHTSLIVHLATFLTVSLLILLSLVTLRRHIRQIEIERDNRRHTAESLAEKVAELETTQNELVQAEKMASLGRMVAGFAHEVNTPVGIAVGAVSHTLESLAETERLLDAEEVTEDALRAGLNTCREASQLALANVQRAAAMVQSFKRTSVDQTSDQDRDFKPAQVIDDVFRGLHNTFKRTRIELMADCPDDLVLHGRAGALTQILGNLVMNSYLHAFAEGERAGEIRIALSLGADSELRIDYHDDGAGMSEATLSHLFEPFFTTRRGQGGSGLGMYIVYNLVTQILKGEIQCTSQPGQGMCCTILAPMKQVFQ